MSSYRSLTPFANEVGYLEVYDRFAQSTQEILDMPNQKIDLLHRFLTQGEGRLSTCDRTKEFAALTNEEIGQIEGLYAKYFGKLQMEG